MLDISIIIILIISTFVGVAWYAKRSSNQRAKLLKDIDNIEPELGEVNQFGALFEQEVQQQSIDNDHFEIDSEPKISLSETAAATTVTNKDKNRINITVDDDINQDSLDISDMGTNTTIDDDALELEPTTANETTAPEISSTVINDWEMVISFTVIARDGQTFSGKSIKTTLESLDLHFGDMQIFHRALGGLRSQTLFSVANILDPGTLNPDSFATMQTPGLLVFARLPGPINGLTLFDDLLDAAQKMTDKLDGILCDESRQALSQSEIEAMRSKILNLNLQLQAEQSFYNNDN